MRSEVDLLPDCALGRLARVARLALAVSLLAAVASCAPESAGERPTLLLRPGGDILSAGSDVAIDDTVPGDVMAAGSEVFFGGRTEGSLLAAGREVFVRGRVDGSIRAAGGAVRLGGSVGRNVTAVGGAVEIRPGASVERNAYMGGGAVQLGGTVAGDAYVAGNAVTVDGHVGGDLRVEASELTLGPEARIDGELRYRLAEDGHVIISTQATIAGGVRELAAREEGDTLLFPLFRLMAFLLFGTVVVAVFPGVTVAMVAALQERTAGAFGLGLLLGILTPVLVATACVTLLGIPLALAGVALFSIVLYAAPIVPSLWLGSAILQGRDMTIRQGALFAFLAGGFTIGLLSLLPGVGFVVRALATLAGLGALVRWIRSESRSRRSLIL